MVWYVRVSDDPEGLEIILPSGEKVRRVVRPRFRAMLQTLAKGGGVAMVAYDLDRAVRDPRDPEDLIDAKVLYGFVVHSTTRESQARYR